jgi:hypothetical protein
MPSYDLTRRGVTYSAALLEAAAVAPTGRAILETFEIFQDVATPDGAIYLVANPRDFNATKELTAERDAGLIVNFMAAPIVADPLDEGDSSEAPEMPVRFSNVSGLVSDAVRLSRGELAPWELIQRLYASDDPTGPAMLPVLSLLVSKVKVTAKEASLTASYGDPSNISIPALKFRRGEYPTLVL